MEHHDHLPRPNEQVRRWQVNPVLEDDLTSIRSLDNVLKERAPEPHGSARNLLDVFTVSAATDTQEVL